MTDVTQTPKPDRMAAARAAKAAKRVARAAEPPAPAPQAISPARTVPGRAVAIGRDGQEITRLGSTVNSDKYHVPPDLIPKDWVYQWNLVEVLGQVQLNAQITSHRGGWRPVPATRHDGIWTPHGHQGDIIQDGLRLEERPKILHDEAQAEERAKARRQVIDQQESLMLSKKGALGAGFSDDAQYRGVGAQVRQTVAPAPDAPRPRLEIDPN